MRNVTRSLIALLVVGGLLGAMQPALAASADENDFFNRINAERTSRGLKVLALTTSLSNVARNHSQEMANNGSLYHNDNLGNEVSGWEELGENVGEGGNVADLHAAFMNSQTHRAEILGNYQKIGIGTVWKDGTLWVTEVFYRAQSATQTTTQKASAPRPRPAVQAAAPRPPVRRVQAPIRAAGAIPAGARPVAPMVPAGVAIPLTSGRLEMLLGDLMIVPVDDTLDDEHANTVEPIGDRGLDAFLWRAAANGGGLPTGLAA